MKKIVMLLAVSLVSCGKTGAPGSNGLTGPMGPQGIQGVPGQAGNSCSVVANSGGATIECTDGTSVPISNGATGPAGSNAMPCSVSTVGNTLVVSCPDGSQSVMNNVTPVQLCPGVTVYPSSFPEYGECIGGSLYAVYWTGSNAFMAEIVPGAYTSTSNSVSCNFTVNTNCNITY